MISVSNMSKVAKEELNELQAERQRDTQNMMETIGQLNRELEMLNLIMSQGGHWGQIIPILEIVDVNLDTN